MLGIAIQGQYDESIVKLLRFAESGGDLRSENGSLLMKELKDSLLDPNKIHKLKSDLMDLHIKQINNIVERFK